MTTDTKPGGARSATSLLLFLSALAIIATGVALYFGWVNGPAKGTWKSLHNTTALLFIVATVLHLVFNWRPMVRHLKDACTIPQGRRAGTAVAVGVFALFLAGTILQFQPFSAIGRGMGEHHGPPPGVMSVEGGPGGEMGSAPGGDMDDD